LRGPPVGNETHVNPLLYLTVPAALAVIGGLLWLTVAFERRVLCPRSMILSTARARHVSPDYAEAFVAREVERLLESEQRVA
jgi:hypothetical protein